MSEKPQVKLAKSYLQEIRVLKYITPEQNEKDTDSYGHIVFMLCEIVKGEMSETKSNRWLGYVQCKLEAKGLLDVPSERERTREIFNGL